MRSRLALLAFVCVGAACDRGIVDPLDDVDPLPGGRTVSLQVGPAGGNFVFVLDGASITLRIPAGALAETTTIGFNTRDATPAQRFKIEFQPEELLFAEPVDVIVQLPPKDRVAAGGTLIYDGVPLAPLENVGGALSGRIRGFAMASFTDFRSDAAGLRATLPPMAHTPPALEPCMGWGAYSVDEFVAGALTAADEVSNALYWRCVQVNVAETADGGNFPPAARLVDATDAYLHRIANGAPPEPLTELRSYSCARLSAAVTKLNDSTVTAFGQFPPLINRVRFLALHGEQVGGTCASGGMNLAAIDARADQALAFYATRVGAITTVATPEYEQAVQEAIRFERAIAELASLGASPAVVAHATTMARDRVHPAILDVVIPPAYAACETGYTDPLIRLVLIMGPRQRLLTALQDCQAP